MKIAHLVHDFYPLEGLAEVFKYMFFYAKYKHGMQSVT
jgi:hypothetical protein